MRPVVIGRGVKWFQDHPWIWIIIGLAALTGMVWWAWDIVSATIGVPYLFHLVAVGLQDFAAALGPWGPFLIIMALAVHSVVIVFPMEIPMLAAFALYGPVGGVLVVWTGSMVAASISFTLGRLIGPPILKRWRDNARVQALMRAVEHLNPMALILLRWISLIPFDVLNMVFGAFEVPLWRFLWTTAIGVLISNVVMAFVYRSALHAHWGQLVGLLAVVFAVGWAVYLWSNRTHLKNLGAAPSDDMKA